MLSAGYTSPPYTKRKESPVSPLPLADELAAPLGSGGAPDSSVKAIGSSTTPSPPLSRCPMLRTVSSRTVSRLTKSSSWPKTSWPLPVAPPVLPALPPPPVAAAAAAGGAAGALSLVLPAGGASSLPPAAAGRCSPGAPSGACCAYHGSAKVDADEFGPAPHAGVRAGVGAGVDAGVGAVDAGVGAGVGMHAGGASTAARPHSRIWCATQAGLRLTCGTLLLCLALSTWSQVIHA